MKIGIINGPNLNLLGSREPGIYGRDGFEAILSALQARYPAHTFVYYQSNIEGELIDAVQDMALRQGCDGILLNAGGYTHTSVALHDAIKAVSVPVLEIHLSQVAAREEFRHTSLIGAACRGSIAGFGKDSYRLGVEALTSSL
ncbi:MAG: 3-dehydroquinate dehydratase [Bacteroidales bacterium]|nr:3-dehydroquinate dehydratase [Bacteroidales bacterium]